MPEQYTRLVVDDDSETMLVLTRRNGEEIKIGGRVTIVVLNSSHGKVTLGIAAPKEIPVHRAEVAARVLAEVGESPLRESSYDRFL